MFSLNVGNTGNLSVFYSSKFKDYLRREFVCDTGNLILNFTLETLTSLNILTRLESSFHNQLKVDLYVLLE